MPNLVAFNTEHPQTTTDARHVPTPSRTARNRLRSVAADSVPDPHQPLGLVGGYPCRTDPPPPGGFFVPFAVSVAPARASEEANRRPANPRQRTTSGLECSRGQQRTEREKRRKARLERRLPEGRAQEDKAGNRANTGGTGKKNPNRIRVGISHYGGAGGN